MTYQPRFIDGAFRVSYYAGRQLKYFEAAHPTLEACQTACVMQEGRDLNRRIEAITTMLIKQGVVDKDDPRGWLA